LHTFAANVAPRLSRVQNQSGVRADPSSGPDEISIARGGRMRKRLIEFDSQPFQFLKRCYLKTAWPLRSHWPRRQPTPAHG
jgi:hypothetical protein